VEPLAEFFFIVYNI